jgi:hypothetical protein
MLSTNIASSSFDVGAFIPIIGKVIKSTGALALYTA